MAMSKKKVPKDLKLPVGGDDDYKIQSIKGKGNSKMKDIKIAKKNVKK